MGQPGCNDVIPSRSDSTFRNIYYNKCKECVNNRQLRAGLVRDPYTYEEVEVEVKDCKHKNTNKSFESNGFVCLGYESKCKQKIKKIKCRLYKLKKAYLINGISYYYCYQNHPWDDGLFTCGLTGQYPCCEKGKITSVLFEKKWKEAKRI